MTFTIEHLVVERGYENILYGEKVQIFKELKSIFLNLRIR